MRIFIPKNFIFLLIIVLAYAPSILEAQSTEKVKPQDIEGLWNGTFTVDYGAGKRDIFPYQMSIKRTKIEIEGYSESTIEINGAKFSAKAHVRGEIHDNYMKCREFENLYEDKLPTPHYWVAFTKMELILKRRKNNQLYLEGLYQLEDGTFGRIVLEKKPPRV